MVKHAMGCLHLFPWLNDIFESLSPATIVTGVGAPTYNCMKLEFGAHVQVFEDHDPTNTSAPPARWEQSN
jgi:hypothetical protein